MMSSVRSDWATPRQLFRMLNAEFNFTLDVCATKDTAVCAEWFGAQSEDGGGLTHPWVPIKEGSVWVNPPYGREIGKWVEKAHRDSAQYYQTVVMLLPARTDTSWFHNYCLTAEVRFLRGRLSYDDQKRRVAPAGMRTARAPFPSMIVVFWAGGKKES